MKTFKIGGIHIEDNKLSKDCSIVELPVPAQVVIMAAQHLGAPSEIIIQKGEHVKVGQPLTKNAAYVGSVVHSSVSGTIAKIDTALDASGYQQQAIYIDVEGDEWLDGIDTSNTLIKDITIPRNNIVDKIKEMGIVGMGGACFPTQVKLDIPDTKKIDYLIINAVECEPYLTCDYRLMLEKGEEIFVGIEILKKALHVQNVYIGIEKNKPQAIDYFRQLSYNYKGIHVIALKEKYPQGSEKQLIKAITKQEVKAGKLPFDVGCTIVNVATVFAVYEAIQKNKPLISRVVTVTGKSVKNPANFSARIGTPYDILIAAAGGLPADTGKIISGGPMMGKALSSTAAYVTKGGSGILMMPDKESHRPTPLNCIRCGKCVAACPMALEPYLLAALAANSRFEEAEKEKVMSCIECGCCIFSCPSYRPLLDDVRLAKFKVGQMIKNRNKQ